MHPDEEKVLRAAALAQKITGSCITVHPCVSKKDGHKYLDILLEEEADISHFYLGHMDITYPDIDLKYIKDKTREPKYIILNTIPPYQMMPIFLMLLDLTTKCTNLKKSY